MREVERLYRLQELDDGIALCERRLQEWTSRLQELQCSVAEVRQSQQEGEKALRVQEQCLRQTEGVLWDQERRLKELEKRLYSDAIRSEKEARALQSEIEQVRQQKDQLESEALQLMLDLDQKRARLDQEAEAEARKARECEGMAQEIAQQEALLCQQVEPLRASREQLAAEISPAALAVYEQVRRMRGGRAVVRVVDNACEGCRLEVALLTRKAALGETLVRCESCGRILFVSSL
jgi:predicted  nucleic acid-binding Zn-ribbon protein